MGVTDDRSDPRLTHGIDAEPRPQAEMYLVLPAEERAKGFIRPVRDRYVHVGPRGPQHPLRELTVEEQERFSGVGYVSYEEYPQSEVSSALGRYWTRAALDKAGKGCGAVTTMAPALAETYAREPHFYGATYCATCRLHLPVADFVWDGTNELVGS